MRPFAFNMDNDQCLIVLPEGKVPNAGSACTFQLYCGNHQNLGNNLNDLNHYAGLITFDWASQEFYYTPGNLSISKAELLRLIAIIKTNIY